MEKSILTLRLTGISFLLIFLLFFFIGSIDHPLMVEFKKADSALLYSQKENGKHPKTRQSGSKDALSEGDQDSSKITLHKDSTKTKHGKPSFVSTPDGVERVLLIGDSQLEGLRNPVSSYCEKNGHVLLSTIIWYGSSTKQWATTDTLEYYLDHYKPTVVLFAIG